MACSYLIRVIPGILILALSIFLSGCESLQVGAKAQATLQQNPQAGIAVVAMIPEELNRTYVGFTAFNNKYEKGDVSSFGVPQKLTDLALVRLKALGRPATAASRSQCLAAAKNYREMMDKAFYAPPSNGMPVVRQVQNSVTFEQSSSYALIFYPGGRSPLAPGGEPGVAYGETGVGTLTWGKNPSQAYISLGIVLMEVPTGKVIANTIACGSEAWPAVWRADFAEYSPEEKQTLKMLFDQLIDREVPATLAKIGL